MFFFPSSPPFYVEKYVSKKAKKGETLKFLSSCLVTLTIHLADKSDQPLLALFRYKFYPLSSGEQQPFKRGEMNLRSNQKINS